MGKALEKKAFKGDFTHKGTKLIGIIALSHGFNSISNEYNHIEWRHINGGNGMTRNRLPNLFRELGKYMRQLYSCNKTMEQRGAIGRRSRKSNAVLSCTRQQLAVIEHLVPVMDEPGSLGQK